MRPTITIGMPVYNGAATIARAILSLQAQTFKDWTLVVSDNASTDSTGAIAAAFAERDPRIRVIHQPRNIGPSANFKAVLASAEAPLFGWLADDDWLSTDWLESLVPVVTAGGCFAFGAVQHVDEAGKPVRHRANGRDLSFIGLPTLRRLRYATDPAYLGKANPIYGLFPRDALTEEAMAIFQSDVPQSDVLLLYHLLASLDLRCDPRTVLFRSVATRAANNPPTEPSLRPNLRPKFFQGTHLPELLALSAPREKAALLSLLPVTTVRFELQKFIPARRLSPCLPSDWTAETVPPNLPHKLPAD